MQTLPVRIGEAVIIAVLTAAGAGYATQKVLEVRLTSVERDLSDMRDELAVVVENRVRLHEYILRLDRLEQRLNEHMSRLPWREDTNEEIARLKKEIAELRERADAVMLKPSREGSK